MNECNEHQTSTMKTAKQYAEEIVSELPYNKKGFAEKIEEAMLDYANECKNGNNSLLADIHHAVIEIRGCKFVRIAFKDCTMDISEYSLPLTMAAIKSIGKNPIEITKAELHEAQNKKMGIFDN